MLIEYFSQYLKANRNVSNRTIKHYITALNTLDSLLVKYEYPVKSVFQVLTRDELDLIKHFVSTNEEYIQKDSRGNRMYSVAFNHYYRFAVEDEQFYSTDITRMDIPISKPQNIISIKTSWKRNQILVDQAIEGAHYCCEHDALHKTFTSASSGKPYMEGHHLIPLKYQGEFNNSLDVYANIVSLCPLCHRLLHFGEYKEKIYTLENIFEQRENRLCYSGIDIPKRDFINLVQKK